MKDGNELRCNSFPDFPTVLYCDDENRVALITSAGFLGNVVQGENPNFHSVASIKNASGSDVTHHFVVGAISHNSPDEYTDFVRKANIQGFLYLDKGLRRVTFSEEFKTFRNRFAPLLKDDLDKLENGFRSEKVSVVNNGNEISCQRKANSSEQNEYSCGIYDCGKGNYLFSHAMSGTFDFVTIENNGNWKFSTPNSIRGEGKNKALFNAGTSLIPQNYLENSFNTSQLAFFRPAFSIDDKVPSELRQNGSELFKKRATTPIFKNLYDQMMSECNPQSVQEIKRSLDDFDQKIRNVELAQYVVKIDDVLKGYFISPDRIPAGVVCDDNTYYQPDAFAKAKEINPHDVPRVVSEAEAQELFKQALAMDDIAWGYKEDGCYARAHLMARRFEKMGYQVDKAWIKGDLVVETGDKKIEWNFHVAPVVYVRDANGNAQPWVIDPSMMEKAAPLEEWTGRMTSKSTGGTVRTTFPFPENAYMYNKAAVAISNSTPYLPNDRIDVSDSSNILMANMTMLEYKGYEQ